MVAGFKSAACTARELQVARVHPKPGTANQGAVVLNKPRVCNLQEAPSAAAPALPKEPVHVWCFVCLIPKAFFALSTSEFLSYFLKREQFVLVAGQGNESPTSREEPARCLQIAGCGAKSSAFGRSCVWKTK